MTTEKQLPTLEEVYEQLKSKPEILALGKVWYAKALLTLIDKINIKQVQEGESTWRLPTARELIFAHTLGKSQFGEWMTWSSDRSDYSDCFCIVNMKTGEKLSDSCGSQVEAYLLKA